MALFRPLCPRPAPVMRRGFTLVELLVVIGIIALLIAILMPALSRAQDHAKRTQCLSNQRQLVIGWMMYSDAFKGKLVDPSTSPTGWIDAGNTQATVTNGLLFNFCPHLKAYHCPADNSDHWSSFVINEFCGGTAAYAVKKIAQVHRPSEVYVFLEEFDKRGANLGSFIMNNTGDVWVDYPAVFHDTGCTLSFADGHAEYWVFADPRTKLIPTHNYTTVNNPDLVRFQKAVGY